MTGTRADVFAAVYRIPKGHVATYGQIGRLARIPGGARQVGYALAALSEHSAVPWHRVVNARGAIAIAGPAADTQRIRLEQEGVMFGAGGRISLKTFGWKPED